MQRKRSWIWMTVAILLLIAGAGWVRLAGAQPGCPVVQAPTNKCTWPAPQRADALQAGIMTAMDSPFLRYTPGWRVTAEGADPPEPAQPFAEPAGALTFTYPGGDLYLLVAPGDYWAYLYVTVGGQPANQLPALPGEHNSLGQASGYKPLLAPEWAQAGAGPQLVLVHRGAANTPQQVRVEAWRGWGQTPLRGVAIDLPEVTPGRAPLPRWPSVLLAGTGVWLLAWAGWPWLRRMAQPNRSSAPSLDRRTVQWSEWAQWLALGALALIAVGAARTWWPLCLLGLGLLALAGLVRPSLWLGALLFGLPFAYGVKLPVLPGRQLDLIDVGVWGGVAVLVGWLVLRRVGLVAATAPTSKRARNWSLLLLAAVTTWALAAAVDARFGALALREWRVVFLNALVFGAVLAVVLSMAHDADADRWLLVGSWQVGAAVVALAGLVGFVVGGPMVSHAEGVRRIQAFYASGNNLALYLDRSLAVSLALVLFLRSPRRRVLWAVLALPQALAWLLTFSKGSLVLAGPAVVLVLAVGGYWLLRREGRSLRPLWLVLGAAVLGVLVLGPFLGAARFQRLFDLGQGTGFLRLQLWRSAGQMALDHPLLGVGPDNFLYYYRSGYLLPAAWQEPNLNHPHNLILDWWTRLGLPGLVLGLAWLGTGVAAVVRWVRSGPDRALALGVLAACAAGLAHGLIDVSYALPDLMLVWVFLFGLGDALKIDCQRMCCAHTEAADHG